jgi:regulator of sigma E protease
MFAQPSLWFIVIAFICAIGPLVFSMSLATIGWRDGSASGPNNFRSASAGKFAGWTDKRGTRWKVGWLPLGGYVRFVGDMNPASQPDPDANIPDDVKAAAFHLRPWWQRFLIVLAGPIANFLLAIVIFSAFFMAYELPNTPPVAAAIARGSAAERAGLRAGDRILAVGSHSIDSFEDLRRTVSIRPNHEVTVEYARGGHEHHIT